MKNSEKTVNPIDIGELLSSQRLQMRENLADVSAQTKISDYIIELMEANQFSDIGSPVYVRGYLTQYAKHLGLDSEYVLAQYDVQYPAETVELRPSTVGSGTFHKSPRIKTKRHSKTVSLLVALLVFGGGLYVYMQTESALLNKSDEHAPPIVTESNNNANVDVVLNEVDAAQNLADDVLSGDNIGNGIPVMTSPSLVTDIELDLAISPAAKAAEKDAQSDKPKKPAPNIELTSIEAAPQPDAAATTEEVQTQTPEENPTDDSPSKRVRMTFKRKSWVKITDATGKKLAGRIYKKGQHIDVTGIAPIKMTIGDPTALRAMTLNGKTVNVLDYQVKGIRFKVK